MKRTIAELQRRVETLTRELEACRQENDFVNNRSSLAGSMSPGTLVMQQAKLPEHGDLGGLRQNTTQLPQSNAESNGGFCLNSQITTGKHSVH